MSYQWVFMLNFVLEQDHQLILVQSKHVSAGKALPAYWTRLKMSYPSSYL